MAPGKEIRRRLPMLAIAGLVAIIALVALACGDDDKATNTPSATGTTAATETTTSVPTGTGTATETATTAPTGEPGDKAPDDQQVLIAQTGEPEKLDPHQSNFAQDITVARMLFRGLYQLDPTGQPVPAMAADMPVLNGNVYTITLKPDLKWSDGVAMTAKDFVYGIQEGCDPDNASPYQYVLASGYAGIVGCNEFFGVKGTADAPLTPSDAEIQAARDAVGVKAIDDLTLEITVEKTTATFATIMALWISFPSRQDVLEAHGAEWVLPENIVGNGPYILKEYTPKDGAVLEPNPNWALEPKPSLKKLTLKFIDDFEAAFRGYQSGDLDMTNVGAQSIPVIEGDETLKSQFLRVGSGRIDTIEANMAEPPLDNFDVRLALSQAMDREAINQVVYNGAYIPALYWVVEGLAGFVGNEEYAETDYNPDAAKESLSRAGYPNGEGFPELSLLLRDDPTQKALGEFLQKQWKDTLGITVNIEFVDAKTRSARFNSSEFQLFRGGWAIDYPDIENVIGGLFDTGGGNNKYNCSDPEIDAKIAEAFAAPDNEARIAAWSEAGKLVAKKLCGVIPFGQVAQLYMVNPKVGGVQPNGVLDSNLPGDWNTESWYIKAQ